MNSQNIRDADRQKLIELAAEIEPAKNESIAKEALGLAHYYLEKSENQAKYIKQLERVNAEQRQRLYEAKYGWSEGEDAEQRWIPVTERLPEYGTEVITINKDDEYEINHVIDEEDGEWFWDGAVAWLPLPSPYKEEVINEKT